MRWMPPDSRGGEDQASARGMYTPKPLVGQSSELPQRLSEVFQLHYETALSGPGASRAPRAHSLHSLHGLPARSTSISAPVSSSPSPQAPSGAAPSHRPSPLPSLSSPLSLGHVPHIAGSGIMPGTHVWASFNGPPPPASPGPPPAPLNFPHFRVRSVLSTDSGSSLAEPPPPHQVLPPQKRPAAAPLPAQQPKKRGRPSRKDKAEAAVAAAAAAAAAANPFGEPQDRSRKLPHILPRASWSTAQVDCATESAAVMLRGHKAKQMSASLGAFTPHHVFTAPVGLNPYSGMSAVAGFSRDTSIGAGFGFPGTPSSIQGASSASCIADTRSEQRTAVAAVNVTAPATASSADAADAPAVDTHIDRSSSRISRISDGGAAAPSPKSVPALDWLMDKLKSQAASRTAASALRSCQEQADESHPSSSAPLRQLSSRLGFPRVGSSSSLHQLSSGGAPSSSRQSRPPASVMAAASELLARHGGMDSRLERLPTVSSAKGNVFVMPGWQQAGPLVESPKSQAEDKGEAAAQDLAIALFPVVKKSEESGENAEQPVLDLDLHL